MLSAGRFVGSSFLTRSCRLGGTKPDVDNRIFQQCRRVQCRSNTTKKQDTPSLASSSSPVQVEQNVKQQGKNNAKELFESIAVGIAIVIVVAEYVKNRRQKQDEKVKKEPPPLYLKVKGETPRPNWKEKCDKIGFPFANYAGVASQVWFGETDPYWNERASYHVHPFGRWQLEKAAYEIHSMCLEAADDIIKSDLLLEKFEIPPELWEAVRQSWAQRQPDIAGRLDLLWDGTNPPKLAEYNADTPTVLIESAIAQEDWFRDVYGQKGEGKKNDKGEFSQFNAISSALEEAFRRIQKENPNSSLLFTTNRPSADSEFLEERSTAKFMQERAKQVALPTQFVDIEDFDDPVLFETILKAASSSSRGGTRPLLIWKLYPYEWLVQEKLGLVLTSSKFLNGNIRWLEPPWKLVLSSKAMLAYLWEKHKGHPNLLPTYWDLDKVKTHIKLEGAAPEKDKNHGWVAKPRFGREGVGIMYSEDYDSWYDFVSIVNQASAFQWINYTNSPKMLGSGSNNMTSFAGSENGGGIMSSPNALLKYLEPYVGSSFDKGAIDSALREREWGSQHSKEESPMSGYFVGKPIFQQYHRPAQIQGMTIVSSAWVVNGIPAGICFRADLAKTTNDDSCFVPHVVARESSSSPDYKMDFEYSITSPKAKRLREEFYGKGPVGNGGTSQPVTYEDYQHTHSTGPVGRSSSGGGGKRSGGRSGFTRFYQSWSSWARGNGEEQNKKSSGSSGEQSSSQSAKQQQTRRRGREKGRGRQKGRFRTGTTARGASMGGRSGRS